MASQRHLSRAPITEALIDLRVSQLAEPLSDASLDFLRTRLQERYPRVERQEAFRAEVKLKEGLSIQGDTAKRRFRGFHFKPNDGLTIAQFRVDGFTYNRLKPYTSWEEILPEAVKLWKLYVAIGAPETVTRTAVRYINHLQLPLAGGALDFSQFLTAPPHAPEGYPRQLSGFLTRLQLDEPDEKLAAIVTQASEPSLEAASQTILFDVDVFSERELSPDDDARLTSTLEQLRGLKNRIFFGALTEGAVRLFE